METKRPIAGYTRPKIGVKGLLEMFEEKNLFSGVKEVMKEPLLSGDIDGPINMQMSKRNYCMKISNRSAGTTFLRRFQDETRITKTLIRLGDNTLTQMQGKQT